MTLLNQGKSPPATYAFATGLFLRLLGVVYLIAFWSLAVQIRGLIGEEGILPAREYMAAAGEWARSQQMGLDRFRLLPTLCWFGTSDTFLVALSSGGAVLATLLIAGIAPVVLLPLLWIDYLSLSVVCGEFLGYQWDTLLLETGLLSIFLAPLALWLPVRGVDPPRVSRWLLWWLLFRLLFGSGVVKLASGDPTWANLTALAFHYETQPLPTPIAWYAHHLPLSVQKVSTAATLTFELVAPWFIFGPRRLRLVACGLSVVLQISIWLTGNYTFFNLLTIALSLLLLDDRTLARVGGALRSGARADEAEAGAAARWPIWVTAAVALITVPVSVVALTGSARLNLPGSAIVDPVANLIAPFRSVNRYGLFAVMSTTRPEIVVEGSNDGTTWLPYEFKYKAGDLRRRPPWVAPHQPRLDWQMWFAALSQYDQEFWFRNFCGRLLAGSPAVLALLAHDPFKGSPPRFIRSELFRYHFSDEATRRREHAWWTRERLGPYSPVVSFKQ
jgi:hypothetical protein